jgi:hypothetical protein
VGRIQLQEPGRELGVGGADHDHEPKRVLRDYVAADTEEALSLRPGT